MPHDVHMTNTADKPNTPGFSVHCFVRFRTDRNGRRFAEEWNTKCRRWVRCNVADFEQFVAQGFATKVEG